MVYQSTNSPVVVRLNLPVNGHETFDNIFQTKVIEERFETLKLVNNLRIDQIFNFLKFLSRTMSKSPVGHTAFCTVRQAE